MIRAYGDWAQHVHAQAFLAATSVTQLGTGLPGPVPAPEPARDIDPAHLSPPTGPASKMSCELTCLLWLGWLPAVLLVEADLELLDISLNLSLIYLSFARCACIMRSRCSLSAAGPLPPGPVQ